MNENKYIQKTIIMDGWMDEWMGWMDGWMGWMDGWMDVL